MNFDRKAPSKKCDVSRGGMHNGIFRYIRVKNEVRVEWLRGKWPIVSGIRTG